MTFWKYAEDHETWKTGDNFKVIPEPQFESTTIHNFKVGEIIEGQTVCGQPWHFKIFEVDIENNFITINQQSNQMVLKFGEQINVNGVDTVVLEVINKTG